MFRSGISLDRSLSLLAEQTPGELGRTSQAMGKLILSGHYFSQAMAKFPWVFTPLQRRLIQVGEKTGAIGEVLEKLSLHEETQVGLKLKIRSALTMPAIICVLCVAMVVFLPPFLFKSLFQMLEDSHVALPAMTRFVMLVSNLFRSPLFWIALVAGVFGLAVLALKISQDRALRLRFFRILMRVPHLGKVLNLIAVNRFSHTLQTTLAVGVPMLAALELAGGATDNAVFEDLMGDVIRQVKDGEALHEALKTTGLFPVAFVQGVQVGLESGQLEHMLKSLGQLFDAELDYMFEVLAAAAEPVVLMIVGFVVGFVVVATLLPMMRLLETL
jgi:type IV pilus assembly protein PilC